MYKKYTIDHPKYGAQIIIIRTSDGAHISSDETHRDYIEYVAWIAEGNTPEEWTPEP